MYNYIYIHGTCTKYHYTQVMQIVNIAMSKTPTLCWMWSTDTFIQVSAH